ncbi:uncharacterized protein LOC122072196 [Macadamia integrifolia]|uniref:uncharacterized protein LOC122072196 n=1 Tax=Macadamia integrifolia TaxID=60698 RepID=UPI001C4E883C|nr:uncharacterized protein LOC122072196 [Macadamia integrifolia]
MKGNQTPQKELPRSAESALRRVKEAPSKSPSDQLKKPLKISKKCLDSSFAAIPEDQSPGKSVSSSIDSDPNSVLVNSSVDQNKQLSEVFKLSMNPEFPVSPVTFDPFEVSPSSTIVEENQEIGSGSIVDFNGTVDCDTPKTGSIDVGIAVDFIREALFQASSSPIVDLRSKKILDSVVKIVIDDMYGFPEEKVPSPDVMSNKLRTGFLYFLLGLVPVSVVAVALSNLFAGSSFPDPPPT